MPRPTLLLASGCFLAVLGLSFAHSSGKAAADNFKVIYAFQGGADGASPVSDLTLDASGNLYGTTSAGGTGTACNGGCGTVFELEPAQSGWKKKVLYNFQNGSDGAGPLTGLIFDSAGNLYGTTPGTVYELSNSHGVWTESTLYTITDRSDGDSLQTDLVFDNQGNLYGTIQNPSSYMGCPSTGCGAVFQLTPQSNGSWAETTLHTFAGAPDGANPSSAVVLDSAGNVYGLTEIGGTGVCSYRGFANCGTAYKLTPGPAHTWTISIIYNFLRGAGQAVYPSGGLLFDHAGHLLGTSLYGGNGYGTIFELLPQKGGSWRQTDPHLFYGNPDGREGTFGFGNVLPRLVSDEKGNLFGVNSYGGVNKGGVVFELERLDSGWKPRILHSFPGFEGLAATNSGLVNDEHGTLYGTTLVGGTGACGGGGCGTVYEVTP